LVFSRLPSPFSWTLPGNELGAECAANIRDLLPVSLEHGFSFYQSLRSVPLDLDEATRSFGLSAWQRSGLEVPFSIPGLV